MQKILRYLLLFGWAVALYAGPFAQAATGVSNEALLVARGIAAAMIVFGAVAMFSGGGRAVAGFAAAAGGTFVMLNAQNIATFLQTL